MKNKLPLLFLLFSFFSFAQNTGLANRTWFVVSAEINNNTTAIPKDHFNFPFAKMNFSNLGLCSFSNELMKDACEKGFSAHTTVSESNNTNGTFIFNDFTAFNTVSNCQTEDVAMQNFMDICIAFFENAQNETFTYIIQDVYGIDNLKIYKSNGDNIWLTEFPFNPVGDELLEITDSNWFLDKTKINDIVNDVPDLANVDFNEIELSIRNFYNDKIYNINTPIESTFVNFGCNMQQYIIDVDRPNQQFFIYFRGGTLSECGDQTVSSFYTNYNNIFNNHLPGPFYYYVDEVEGGGANHSLVITNSQGNQAFYQTHYLNVKDDLINLTKIYPNPVINKLYIETPSAIKKIIITDTLGRQLLESTNTTIDFSTIEKGCYYVTIIFKNNMELTKKILH